MRTKKENNVTETPFYNLFKKHPWLVPLLLMFYRQTGVLREFIDVYVKPHSKNSEFVELDNKDN
jgi:hypothetical protein